MSTDIHFQAPAEAALPTPPQRTQRGLRRSASNLRKASEGTAQWSTRPFGYAREGSKAVVVEEEAAALRWAVQELLGGATLASVARRLTEQGHATTAGNAWSAGTLRKAVLNPRLAGEQVYCGEVLRQGDWAPILDVVTQQRLREALSDPVRKTSDGNDTRSLLSGIARCGLCGARLWSMGRKDAYICRDGGGHLQRKSEPVDEYVASVVPVMLARQAHALSNLDEEKEWAEELAAKSERRNALVGMLADGLVPPEEARAQAVALTTRIRELELLLATPRRRTFFGRVAGAQARWDSLSLADRRGLIQDNLRITIKSVGRGAKLGPEQYVEIAVEPPPH